MQCPASQAPVLETNNAFTALAETQEEECLDDGNMEENQIRDSKRVIARPIEDIIAVPEWQPTSVSRDVNDVRHTSQGRKVLLLRTRQLVLTIKKVTEN